MLEFAREGFNVASVGLIPVNCLFTHAVIAHSFPPGGRSWIFLRRMCEDAVHAS